MMNLQREQRIDQILSSLKNLDYLSTSQLQRLHNLGGERNARRVMSSISEYVSSFREGENVYYLNKAGRERIGTDKIRTKISPVTHYLMRNDLFIHRKPSIFSTEPKITVGDTTIIPDVWMQLGGGYFFIEIDNTQRMTKNKEKIAKYRKIKESGAFQGKYGYFPRLLWVTALEGRKKSLSELCSGLDNAVLLWDEIK